MKSSKIYIQYYPDGIIIGSTDMVNQFDLIDLPEDIKSDLSLGGISDSYLAEQLNEFMSYTISK